MSDANIPNTPFEVISAACAQEDGAHIALTIKIKFEAGVVADAHELTKAVHASFARLTYGDIMFDAQAQAQTREQAQALAAECDRLSAVVEDQEQQIRSLVEATQKWRAYTDSLSTR